MGAQLPWLIVTVLGAAGVVAFIVVRHRSGSPRPRSDATPSTAASPSLAVARTHFADGGGYVEIDGVVRWATADPASRIRPGHVLRFDPVDDSHTVSVVLVDDPTREDDPA